MYSIFAVSHVVLGLLLYLHMYDPKPSKTSVSA